MDSPQLDDLDRRLTHAFQLDGRVPFSRLAEVLGVSDQTVARRYHRLRSAGVVRVVGVPEVTRLGRVQWLLRVRCMPDAAGVIATALARRDDTSWVSLTSRRHGDRLLHLGAPAGGRRGSVARAAAAHAARGVGDGASAAASLCRWSGGLAGPGECVGRHSGRRADPCLGRPRQWGHRVAAPGAR
ncbi:AsnC family protein [Amycolatopsis sp. NPDC051372]|uniref:Lrp/AsnC family transcriptional regulator n=1 Tax=Amycolatopsis sp. NPDC051372 TaxID=3155669 RepID=UPI0034387326